MDLDEVFMELRRRNESVPRPLRLPTASETDEAGRRLGVAFHPDFRRYLLEASDVVYGVMEPVIITRSESHTDLFKVIQDARDCGVPRELLPICDANADFYCITPTGEIVFWSHNGVESEKWNSLAAWIKEIWLAE